MSVDDELENILDPISDPLQEYLALHERTIKLMRKERKRRLGVQYASLAVAYDLCFGLNRDNNSNYGRIFFGKDFDPIKNLLPEGYQPLKEGYEEPELTGRIFKRNMCQTDKLSPLVQRMQAFIAEAEMIRDYRQSLQLGNINNIERSLIENRLRYQNLLPELRIIYQELLSY